MKTKKRFVERFICPQTVICQETMTSFGVCLGAKVFANGWFALMNEDSKVVLYNHAAQEQDSFIDDVFVFENGCQLKKHTYSDLWMFLNTLGTVLIQSKEVRVYKNELAALKNSDTQWVIYRMHKYGNGGVESLYLTADDLTFYQDRHRNYVLFAVTKDRKTTLQSRTPLFRDVAAAVENVCSFVQLAGGYIAVSDVEMCETGLEQETIIVEAEDNHPLDVYGSVLAPVAKGVYGVATLGNGMYLLKSKAGEWKLFTETGQLIQDNIFDLHVYDEPDENLPTLLLASSSDNKYVALKCREDGWLSLTYGAKKKLISQDGKSFDDSSSAGNVFIV